MHMYIRSFYSVSEWQSLSQYFAQVMDRQTGTLDELSSPGEETDGADTSAESESESCVILPVGPSAKKIKVTTVLFNTL